MIVGNSKVKMIKYISKRLVKRIIPAVVLIAVMAFYGLWIDRLCWTATFFRYWDIPNIDDYPIVSDPYQFRRTQAVYAKRVGPGGILLEVGIFPKLTEEIEEEIKSAGEPYTWWFIRYKEVTQRKSSLEHYFIWGRGLE